MRRDVSQPEGPRHGETVSFASHVCPVLGRLSLTLSTQVCPVRKQSSVAWPNNLQSNRAAPPSL